MRTGRCSVHDSVTAAPDSGPLRQAAMAHLPVDVLVDPDTDVQDDWLRATLRDAVRPERLRHASTVVAGWGDQAWRASIRAAGDDYEVTRPAKDAAWAPSRGEWSDRVHRVLDDFLPPGVDAETRLVLVRQVLELPLRDLEEQDRLLRLLLAAHRTLRRSARRVLLQAVANYQLGVTVPPETLPAWQFLARLTRTPSARLAGATSRAVLVHDARPQCPTARRWADG